MATLIRRIKRDIKKSPAKATALGGLLVLAVAIWGSKLVATPNSVVQGSMVANTPQVLSAAVPMVAPEQISQQVTAVQEANIDLAPWHVIQTWRDQSLDENTRLPHLDRDPFAISEIVALQSGKGSPSDSAKLPLSPEDLGLRFTGVVISAQYRAAIFENQAMSEGSALKIERDGVTHLVKITEVHPTRIKFTIDGTEYEQSLPELGLESKITLKP